MFRGSELRRSKRYEAEKTICEWFCLFIDEVTKSKLTQQQKAVAIKNIERKY